MKQEIKKAVLDVIMASIDKGNYGMLSTRKASYHSYKIYILFREFHVRKNTKQSDVKAYIATTKFS